MLKLVSLKVRLIVAAVLVLVMGIGVVFVAIIIIIAGSPSSASAACGPPTNEVPPAPGESATEQIANAKIIDATAEKLGLSGTASRIAIIAAIGESSLINIDYGDEGWTIGKKSAMPHMLCIGPTGGGKTTLLRSLIVGAVAQGILVMAADPKMIELTPFYRFPGVYVASTGAEIAKMIEAMEKLMYDRYELIKRNPNAADSMRPVLFVLDELLILRQVLKRFHARSGADGKPGKGTPPWFDSIAALLALARSALINVVIGVQRPDAALFDDGARDNLRQRVSLMRLSAQGSAMLWGTPYIGVDLPMVQGRAMASPDGENPIEMQTFWVADPITATGADADVIEAFRQKAEEWFSTMELPVDVSPFINDRPEFDHSLLPASNDDVLTGAADEIDEATPNVSEYDTQNVSADAVTEGDRIVLESGEAVEITAVEDDPFDDDSVSFVVSTLAGDESVSMARNDYVARVLELGADG